MYRVDDKSKNMRKATKDTLLSMHNDKVTHIVEDSSIGVLFHNIFLRILAMAPASVEDI